MSSTVKRDQLLEDAQQLSVADRLILAQQLLDTLPDDLPGLDFSGDELAQELLRRSGDYEDSITWSELRNEQ